MGEVREAVGPIQRRAGRDDRPLGDANGFGGLNFAGRHEVLRLRQHAAG